VTCRRSRPAAVPRGVPSANHPGHKVGVNLLLVYRSLCRNTLRLLYVRVGTVDLSPNGRDAKNRGESVGSLVRRIRWWGWTIFALVIVMVAAGGFVWTEHALSVQMATVSPVQGARLASSSVKITCALPGFAPGRGSVSVTVDGKPVDSAAVALHTDGVEATVSLPDGAHTVDVEYNSANIFSRRLSRSWGFSIDTTAPEVHVVSPSPAALPLDFAVSIA